MSNQCGERVRHWGKRHPVVQCEDLPLFRILKHVLSCFHKIRFTSDTRMVKMFYQCSFPGNAKGNKQGLSSAVFCLQKEPGDQSPRYFRKDQSFGRRDSGFGRLGMQAIPSADYTDEVKLSFGCFEMELVQKNIIRRIQKQLGELKLIGKLIQNVPCDCNANLAVLGAECDYSNSAITEVQQNTMLTPFLTNILLINNVVLVSYRENFPIRLDLKKNHLIRKPMSSL